MFFFVFSSVGRRLPASVSSSVVFTDTDVSLRVGEPCSLFSTPSHTGAKRPFRESIEYTFVSFEGSNPHCDARTGWGGVFFFLSPQQPGKPIVDGVTGLDGDNVSFDGLAYKGDVADDVQQFVSGRFVVPYEENNLNLLTFPSTP